MDIKIFAVLTIVGLMANAFANNDNSYYKGNSFTDSDSTILLSLGGNTWAQNVTYKAKVITTAGIENWTDKQTQFNTYLRVTQPGSLKIRLRARTDGKSSLQLT